MQVAPLSRIPPSAFQRLLAEESELWLGRLGWDYRPTAALIRRYGAQGSLSGLALVDGAQMAGYTYFVIDPPVGYLGNVFVTGAKAGEDAYGLLLEPALERLQGDPRVERIECQLFPFNFETVDFFSGAGFATIHRQFLSLDLAAGERVMGSETPTWPGIRTWQEADFKRAVEIIFDSYQESTDFHLCRDYQSRSGCARFLRNLIQNPGCGRFSPEQSRVAVDAAGQPVAVLITSLISPGCGMIPQISVARSHQGQGLGTHLLRDYFSHGRAGGLVRTSLSVSLDNRGAYRLYRRLGFRRQMAFQAFIWNRRSAGA